MLADPGDGQVGVARGQEPSPGVDERDGRCRSCSPLPIGSGTKIRRPADPQMISGLDRVALRAEARAFFGLDADRPTLVVTGGSPGCTQRQHRRRRRRPCVG